MLQDRNFFFSFVARLPHEVTYFFPIHGCQYNICNSLLFSVLALNCNVCVLFALISLFFKSITSTVPGLLTMTILVVLTL
jgi:hypothetical protein